MAESPALHWDNVYRTKPSDELSWFEMQPGTSLRLLTSAASRAAALVDVGAGTACLVDALVDAGWLDVTVLDVSSEALAVVRQRLGERRGAVSFVAANLLSWEPMRIYDAWHDRAVFHFLVDPGDRNRYIATANRAVGPGGVLVLGAFASDGPRQCSGLPTARYSAEALAAAFLPAFVLVHSEREEHPTPDAAIQPFTWVVLRRT